MVIFFLIELASVVASWTSASTIGVLATVSTGILLWISTCFSPIGDRRLFRTRQTACGDESCEEGEIGQAQWLYGLFGIVTALRGDVLPVRGDQRWVF